MDGALQRLLDMNQPFDVELLDQVVQCTQNPMDRSRATAHEILMTLQQDPNMW